MSKQETTLKLIEKITQAAIQNIAPEVQDIEALLELEGACLTTLYSAADKIRQLNFGDDIHLRGIVEFSNDCDLHCRYCGISKGNKTLARYHMSASDIVELAAMAKKNGCQTLVLQSGENKQYSNSDLADLIKKIKSLTDIAITLSTGKATYQEYLKLADSGCDRFLLRFETSDKKIFHQLHPDDDFEQRQECLHNIRKAGMQLGSGFMIGLPKTTLNTLAKDILFATQLQLDMIGCGPFIAHPQTPLANQTRLFNKDIYFKTIAILRLLNPHANIPATTAFDLLEENGRESLLNMGANVYMPNITPQKYRQHYQLYKDKPDIDDNTDLSWLKAVNKIKAMGRNISKTKGHSPRVQQ